MKKYLTIVFCLVSALFTSGKTTKITNGKLWYDTKGNVVQAHGGNILYEKGIYYLVGEDRSDPYHPDVNLYSTKDFKKWKFCGKIIKNGHSTAELGTTRLIERPKLLHCKKTGKYIIWCHYEASDYSASEVGVFSADKITGPYKLEWSGRPLGIKSRDCNVFVDNDGTAYFISTIEENRHLGLFRLTDDYLRPLECTVLMKDQRREAPAIARVGDTYYMLSSACTGWEPNQCMLSWSHSLTEGWSPLQPIGDKTAFDTQASSILEVDRAFIYIGDRWKDPDLPQSKIIMFPIRLHDGTCDFEYKETFQLDF